MNDALSYLLCNRCQYCLLQLSSSASQQPGPGHRYRDSPASIFTTNEFDCAGYCPVSGVHSRPPRMRGAAQLKAEYETKARGCRYSIQGARRDSLRRLTASNIISGPGSVTLARHAAVAVLPGLGTVTIIKMEIFITVSSAIKTIWQK